VIGDMVTRTTSQSLPFTAANCCLTFDLAQDTINPKTQEPWYAGLVLFLNSSSGSEKSDFLHAES